jgi:hypothetical protein
VTKTFEELKKEVEAKESFTKSEVVMFVHLAHNAGVILGTKVTAESITAVYDLLNQPMAKRETA